MVRDMIFEERLHRLAQERRTGSAAHRLSRRERAERALAHLEAAGISRARAYPLSLRMLSRLGLVLAPMHYWSAPALMLGTMVIFTMLATVAALGFIALGVLPEIVQALIVAGPVGMIAVIAAMSALVTATHRMEAARADLPPWSSL